MRRKLFAGTINVCEPIFVNDLTSTTGAGLAGVAFNSSGIVCEYRRSGQSTWTTITLSSGTLGTPSGSATLGTIIADGALVGAYELGLPDNVFAAGARHVVVRLRGVSNMLPVQIFYELDAINYQDSVRVGMTALPNAAAAANGGLPTVDANNAVKLQSGTGANQISLAAGLVSLAAAQTCNITGSLSGSVGSVTAGVTVTTNNDKAGYGLSSGERTTLSGVILTDTSDTLGADIVTLGTIATAIKSQTDKLQFDGSNYVKSDPQTTVSLTLSAVLSAPRALDTIADGAITLNDALWCAVCAAAGQETIVGTAYTVKTPHTATAIRAFTLDSATAPTQRT